MRQGSFVRKGAAPAADPGTRPGLHGQTLLSLGQADLDRLLGGGLPLGALLLLLDDGWSGHAATLLRYFLAEGAACGQSLLLAAAPAPAGGLPAFVPPQLKRGSAVDKDEEGGEEHVGRLAVLSLGSLGWQATPQPGTGVFSSGGGSASGGGTGASAGTAVLRTLLQLKGTLRDRRCAAVVSVPAMLFSPSDLARMQHLADGVVALESVADGSDIARLAPDPASVAGLLHLRKPPALGTTSRPAPDVALHLVRHRRRRLAITPVEIDPDAEVADAEATSGAGRSAASALCGGPPKPHGGALDF
ncbi:elongator complex 4 [Micractinium conductrix]|uniref:Elongator complex protein 4 n=1 Tax=Micractinium conductrix TaxID=554055 RepID=A0A2P6V2U7_9CHLO|nr:elongator complex 4 [Micractinium conductrix]|eukprot:PSC68407.1 elongator complex 4 [Micractinium conductrix]